MPSGLNGGYVGTVLGEVARRQHVDLDSPRM
jgi:hypothetical protein